MSNEHNDEDFSAEGVRWDDWKQIGRIVLRYRFEVSWLGAQALITGLLEALYPLLNKSIIDHAADGGDPKLLGVHGLAYLGLTLAFSICVKTFISLGGKLRTHVSHDIREAGFANLQRLSFSFFDRRSVGWLMTRMTSDCDRVANIFAWGFLDIIWGITQMLGITLIMLLIDVQLALVVLAVMPVLLLLSAFFKRRLLGSSRRVRRTNSKLTAAYNEALMGIRTTKTFASEPNLNGSFRSLSSEMHGASVENGLLAALYLPCVISLASLATGLALVFGGVAVASDAITIGTLVLFLFYARNFFEPVQEIAHWFAEFQMAQASAERVIGLIQEVPEVADSEQVLGALRRSSEGSPLPGIAADGHAEEFGAVELDHVDFAYATGPPVLKDVSVRIEPGQVIALVGSTGGGKSTLANLICRFYDPTAGVVRVGGVDLKERSLEWLQAQLGIVLQAPHLFSGTIAENIRYGKLDAKLEEIREAARVSGAHAFIEALPEGYETEVGEGGARLSGGQRQLVSFARAILSDPQLLILDEATSSVDTETEQAIQRGLQQVLAGRTSIVIAHRLSTIRSADRILVVEGGRIVESGTHASLLAQRGRYHELTTEQSLRESRLSEVHDAP